MTETYRIGKNPTPGVTLLFTGWGMDAQPFMADMPADRDCIVCYDYTSLDFSPKCAAGYHDVLIVAWSLGVWAAAWAIPQSGLRYSASIAVNGTMHPVDDENGIPAVIFTGTMTGLSPASLKKFHRRMFTTQEDYKQFCANAPQRSFPNVQRELQAIGATAQIAAPTMQWDCAVIGLRDRIVPPANQCRAWDGIRNICLNDSHFLASWRAVLDGTILQ